MDDARAFRIPPIRLRGIAAPRMLACVVLGSLSIAPVIARDGCVALAPGADGVLRLDGGRAMTWPCAGPLRVYAAAPSGGGALPVPRAAAPMPSPRPRVEAPATVEPGASPAAADIARFKEQAARLADQLARLNDETASLRAETGRLRDQLSRRETGDADAIDRRGDDKQGSRIGPAAGADARGPEKPAPKGDMLSSGPAKDAARAAASPEAKPTEQLEFERRKSVAARAWSELLDFAARMKRDLSGKSD